MRKEDPDYIVDVSDRTDFSSLMDGDRVVVCVSGTDIVMATACCCSASVDGCGMESVKDFLGSVVFLFFDTLFVTLSGLSGFPGFPDFSVFSDFSGLSSSSS